MIISVGHPLRCKWHYFILSDDSVVFHCIYDRIFSTTVYSRDGFRLAIVNSAAIHVSFRIMPLSDVGGGVGFLGHIATLFLVFGGSSVLFSVVAVLKKILFNFQ